MTAISPEYNGRICGHESCDKCIYEELLLEMVYQQVSTNQFENTCENICGAEYKKLFLCKEQTIVGYTDERYGGCYDGDVENGINISHVTVVVDIIGDIPMPYR